MELNDAVKQCLSRTGLFEEDAIGSLRIELEKLQLSDLDTAYLMSYVSHCPDQSIWEAMSTLFDIFGFENLQAGLLECFQRSSESDRLKLAQVSSWATRSQIAFWQTVFYCPRTSDHLQHRIVAGLAQSSSRDAIELAKELVFQIPPHDNPVRQAALLRLQDALPKL